VLHRLGLRHEAARDGRWYGLDDVQYWRIDRADWRPPESPYRLREV
jgi:hypothetical protein